MAKTKEEKIEEIAARAEVDLLDLLDDLFGADRVLSEQENEHLDKLLFLAKDLLNKEIDFDLVVTVKIGTVENDNLVVKTKRKSLLNALCVGFNVPENAACLDISVRPMVVVEGLNGEVVKKQYKTKFFNKKIYIENENISYKEAKQKFGMKDEDVFAPATDFVDSSVLHFANLKQNEQEFDDFEEFSI